MVADKDSYYKNATKGELSGFFGDFGEISMPLMNMAQAQKMFKELKHKKNKSIQKPLWIFECFILIN